MLTASNTALGVNDTLALNGGNGTLFVGQGAVFTGNGLIQGHVRNAGLVRIPIVSLAQVTGGTVQIQAAPVIVASAPVVVNTGTFVSFQHAGGGGGGGSGGGASGAPGAPQASQGSIAVPQVITLQDAAPVVRGSFSVDARLQVTGSYTQEATGMLRLFVGGHDQAQLDTASRIGGTYSQLFVGEAVALDGELQIVLQPELFAGFHYTPKLGDSFDFVLSDVGITLSPTLVYSVFVTEAGRPLLTGLSFSAYSSGLAGDPDKLYRIGESVFSFSLVDDGHVLRGTLNQSLHLTAAVPEPERWLLLMGGLVGLAAWRKRLRRTAEVATAAH